MGDRTDQRRLKAEQERDLALERLRQTTAELEESDRRYRRIFERTKDVIIVSSPEGHLIDINPAGLELYGYPSKDAMAAIDLRREMWADPSDRDEYVRQLGEFGYVKDFEADHKNSAGRVISVIGTSSIVRNQAGEIIELLTILRDITEQKRLSSELERLARTDSLTGVANRVVFRERLELATAQWRSSQSGFTLLMLDLDNLKQVNDSWGHPAGDAVLTAVAQRFQDSIGEADVLARFGGDEFALILAEASTETEAEAVAQRLLSCLAPPIELAGHPIHTSVSIGIACPWSKKVTSEKLLQRADRALYRAKRRGGNQFAV
jgi:diguanylate cyclase (GGDEF)-like protein/PAS domain S-box-containing protein